MEQDIQLFELMRSIQDKGVLVPLIVRSNPYGDGYEIIAGHRRKAACTWDGIEEVPVIVRELDDSDAVIAMLESNLQREHIKPSEKAYAHKMKLEAIKSQGQRIDLSLLRSAIFPNITAEKGEHEFIYSLLPYKGNLIEGGTIEEANRLNLPAQAVKGRFEDTR